ncbi:response regulator transcription factor [Corynebacterium freiburgense]|uniref:response regulator transcription factor n=1 Tax=Corynebacterium freiburgense TaxID=556548 RepID=UPI0004149B1C|nr:response regulator transcription factor [Corynebacterium freiburgense]MDO4686582.1 response regulator transcription factor [Corynebacterium sp.]WJZ02017.1 Transcriptional regulatory protein DegU [Corynebacterium freiburgense]
MTKRIILVDDHALMLRGLSLIFETIDGCDVVATTTDGREVSKLINEHQPDVVVTDAVMPGFDGLAVVTECARLHPEVPVLVLTTFDDASLVRSLIDAGAAGYLLKDVSAEHLFEAIQAAAEGGIVLDPRIARIVHRRNSGTSKVRGIMTLTRAERAVAELVAQGANNKQIAAQLFLAEGTVKNHVSHLLRKLDAADRTVLALKLAKSFGYLNGGPGHGA